MPISALDRCDRYLDQPARRAKKRGFERLTLRLFRVRGRSLPSDLTISRSFTVWEGGLRTFTETPVPADLAMKNVVPLLTGYLQ